MPVIPANSDADSLSQQTPAQGAGYAYDDDFFRYIHEGAIRSAQQIVPLIIPSLRIQSVLDVGCGAGAWLSVYRKQGVRACLGVDGAYVRAESLLVPAEVFQPQDITQPFDLKRRFDLVQCLEAGEHIPKSASKTLVENLVRHGSTVLFSAAIPGQGGENHVNEQSYEFWRQLFAGYGYKPFDFLRPAISSLGGIEVWYRNNLILYVAQESIPVLSRVIADTRVLDGKPIANVAGWLYKIRIGVFSSLPVSWLSKLAMVKHRCVLTYRALLR
jgi:SAM-dependent methyltransferase